MNFIFDTVKNIVIYLILITVVMNLMGNSSYKKYIGIFSGMILIVIVASPLLNVLNLNQYLDYYLDIQRFNVDRKELDSAISIATKEQKENVMKEYKNTIEKQVEIILNNMNLTLIDFDADITTDLESKEYGAINQISIRAELGIDSNEESKKRVKKVTIDKIIINRSTTEKQEDHGAKNGEASVIKSLVKQEVAGLYGLDENQIMVEIQVRE